MPRPESGARFSHRSLRTGSVPELDIPIRDVEEMFPAVVWGVRDRDVDERPPLRTFRLPDELHLRLVWKAVALARIARDARADDVLPRRLPAAVAGQHVVEIQVFPVEQNAAILAGVPVPLEHIVPGELDLFFGQPLEEHEHDDPRDPDVHGYRLHHLGMVGILPGKIPPAVKIMRQEPVPGIGRNRLGVALIEESESAAGTAGIHRLPEAVQHQHRSIEDRLHRYCATPGLPPQHLGLAPRSRGTLNTGIHRVNRLVVLNTSPKGATQGWKGGRVPVWCCGCFGPG